MQRWLVKIRDFSLPAMESLPFLSSSRGAVLHSSPQFHRRISFTANSSSFKSSFVVPLKVQQKMLDLGFQSSFGTPLWNRSRHFSSKERRLKRLTPVKSKVKKIKMKSYSSFKSRFRTMSDGQIRRWHAGKRHNAHLKSKKAKRRLRQPDVVHPAYAKVMKKLNFCG